jgi:hypothetical protein
MVLSSLFSHYPKDQEWAFQWAVSRYACEKMWDELCVCAPSGCGLALKDFIALFTNEESKQKKWEKRAKWICMYPFWILRRIIYVFTGPIFYDNSKGRRVAEVKTSAEILCYEYTERTSWVMIAWDRILSILGSKEPADNKYKMNRYRSKLNRLIRSKLNWKMAQFFASVILALLPVTWSLVQSVSTKFPLCTSASDCLTVPAKNMCNFKYSCTLSDFKVACSQMDIQLRFSSERCELTGHSDPVVSSSILISSSLASPPYSECWSFRIELILYLCFLFSCILFWLFERNENLCFKVAFPNGYVLDSSDSHRYSFEDMGSSWIYFKRIVDLDSLKRRWSLVRSETDLIRCAIAR